MIRLTPEAQDDLANISAYTWQIWGEQQALIYEAEIAKALETLRQYPRLGRMRANVFPGCRSIQVQQHVIYYHQPQETVIEVLRILHHREDGSNEIEIPPT